MNKKLSLTVLVLALFLVVFALARYSSTPNNIPLTSGAVPTPSASSTVPEPAPHACTMEAKICPDGSAVGRGGPNCEFAACPTPESKSAKVTTSIGQKTTAIGLSLTPRALVSDSRCPLAVQCVWAGTVEVRALVEIGKSQSEHVFKINEAFTFGDYTVTLLDVTPIKQASIQIPASAYRFTFEISRK